jgi:hypothetical protein
LLLLGALVWPLISIGWILAACHRAVAAAERVEEIFAKEPEAQPGPCRSSPATSRSVASRSPIRARPGRPRGRRVRPPPRAEARPRRPGRERQVDPRSRCCCGSTSRRAARSASTATTCSTCIEGAARALRAGTAGPVPVQRHDRRQRRLRPRGRARLAARSPGRGGRRRGPRGRPARDPRRARRDRRRARHHALRGQKQRTSLARALASDRPALILDDTLSAVDVGTEAKIVERLAATADARRWSRPTGSRGCATRT